jgi:type II secretory pathway component PulM
MRTARRNSLRINLSKREQKQLLLLAIFMVLALLYGLYIGWWSLHKEEEEHTSKTFSELRGENFAVCITKGRAELDCVLAR